MVGLVPGRQPAFNKLREQSVATFLQITAVRHLGDDVRGAQQIAQHAEDGIGQTDRVDRPLIACKVNDPPGDRGQLCHAQLAKVTLQKSGAAANMLEGVFGTVLVPHVGFATQIPDIVKQSCDGTQTE